MRSRALSRLIVIAAMVLVATVGCTGTSTPDERSEDTTSTTSEDGATEQILAEIDSILAVSSGPTSPTVVDLPGATVTRIVTYHWNDAAGATPGTVALEDQDGVTYGPFPTVGSEGQGGVPNAYWTADVDLDLPEGTYEVIDSDPSTWAWNEETGGRGIVTIFGIPG